MAAEAAVPEGIFRAYDIRGTEAQGLTAGIMALLGRAIGSEALDLGETRLIVACDVRLSSPGFCQAMEEGILSTGCDVINIGMAPTPVLYFATRALDCGSGVMITGSHNPRDYNGVKIVLKRQCLAENQISRLRKRILNRDFHAGRGASRHRPMLDDYVARVAGGIALEGGMNVAIDCGNGVAGTVAPRLFEALGCKVSPLYCEPDGRFPHHHPDPTRPENLRDLIRLVQTRGAALGIALDGDGDRVGLVSDSGAIIDTDKLMMCFIRDILPDNPGANIVFDVKSSAHLPRLIQALGGNPIPCPSGHSLVKRKMEETGALFGGEFSAHIFFKHRWYGFDDGLYAAARFLELMHKTGRSADELLQALPESCGTGELFIDVNEADKFSLTARFQREMRFPGARITTLDGLRADFPHGWGLIRASNTTPRLVLRFEGDSPRDLDAVMAAFKREIRRIDASLNIDF